MNAIQPCLAPCGGDADIFDADPIDIPAEQRILRDLARKHRTCLADPRLRGLACTYLLDIQATQLRIAIAFGEIA